MLQQPSWMTQIIFAMSFPGTRKELEDYLEQSRHRHRNLFNSSIPGSLVFSNNHILYKTAELHGDVPADQQKKTCLDIPFDIGLCAEHAIKRPPFHGLIITKNNFWRQFYIAIVDVLYMCTQSTLDRQKPSC